MNEGDCRCIRYIDDFIILAPTKKAASARMRKAIKLLAELGMELSPEKSSQEPNSIQTSFEFLGIEFSNGFIRPSTKSHQHLMTQIDSSLQTSLSAFRAHRSGHVFPKSQSLVSALKRIDGIIQGWGKHYRFCNDDTLIQNLDGLVKDCLRAYIGAYADTRERSEESERQYFLGVEKLSSIKREPFLWPTIENPK